MKPKISVIMPAYNAERYISATIKSILNQTFKNFEFIIIDDGSTDKTFNIITSFKDPRIRLYKNKLNIGYVKTLNKLIKLSNGKYIARQDNDDISLPLRLQKQFYFLETHKDVGVCGTNAKSFGEKNTLTNLPLKNEDILVNLLFSNPILHSSVMFRKSILTIYNINYYDESLCPCEDYFMWYNISKYTKLANLDYSLIKYRLHKDNTSKLRSDDQKKNRYFIKKIIFKETLNYHITKNELDTLNIIFYHNSLQFNDLKSLDSFFKKIIERNKELQFYNENLLKKTSIYFLAKTCIKVNNISNIHKIRFILNRNFKDILQLSNTFNYKVFYNIINYFIKKNFK